MKKHDGEPWMPADEYGRSLKGFGINLLARDMARSMVFQRRVLGAGCANLLKSLICLVLYMALAYY